uniref:peptidyl-tRNA hydrolase n=1 Tax=Hucho hucho TaxID=62062 RepID=A0A4W5PGX9_9TELE
MEPSEQQQTGPGSGSGSQEVNPVYLQQLRELDIPEEAAKQALLHTRNVSAEEAAMYYFNKLENEEEGDDDLMFKMVFVVNMDLAMGVGKLAAQVGHAAVGLYQALQEKNSWREMAWKWDHGGAKKVVVQGTNMAHLLELQALAMSLSLPTYLVQDAGRTQVRHAPPLRLHCCTCLQAHAPQLWFHSSTGAHTTITVPCNSVAPAYRDMHSHS